MPRRASESTQAVPVRHRQRRAVLRPRLDLLHRAPVRAVAPSMNVPLGVLRPPAFDGSRPPGSPPCRSRTRRCCRLAFRRASGASARRRPEGRRRRAGAPPPASARATGRTHLHRRRGSRRGPRRCGRRPRPLRARPAPRLRCSRGTCRASSPSCRRGDRRQQIVARGSLRSCPAGRRSSPGSARQPGTRPANRREPRHRSR